jgi:HlyD family secretion protein
MDRALTCALLSAALAGCLSSVAEQPDGAELRVRRGTFASEIVLSGELEAPRGDVLTVPPLPSWQSSIKWLIDDGTTVKAGDRIVELDSGDTTAELDSKRQGATQALQELNQKQAEWAADLEDKQLDVEKKQSELDKAKLESVVPKEILSGRSWEEKQTALRRATVEYDKAVDLLKSRRVAAASERANIVLRIDKAQREIAIAERALDQMVLRAPRDGIVVIRDHPWEGRKLQTGDAVWVGFPIAMLPELDSLRVKATLADVDDGKIATGTPVVVTMDGYPDLPFTGRIAAIAAIAQESRRSSLRRQFDVLVALDRLDRARMQPGLTARVAVRRQVQPAVLLVSRAALDFSGKVPRARVAGGTWKNVKLGPCNAQECVVTGGLDEGDRLAAVVEVRHG